MRYLEYDEATGRIISEITSESEPPATAGIGLLVLDDDAELDTTCYAVKNKRLVKITETDSEREERERIRREHQERMRVRLNSMCREAIIALLKGDKEEFANLQREFQRMESSL